MADLIKRSIIFGDPERALLNVSPDGKFLSWLAPLDGVLNVWVAPRENPDEIKSVTRDRGRGIRLYGWCQDGRHLAYMVDSTGAENWHVWVTSVDDQDGKDLTPFEDVRSTIADVSPDMPDEILISINRRNPQYMDSFALNYTSGELRTVFENDRFAEVFTDASYRVRMGIVTTEDGGAEFYIPDNPELSSWRLSDEVGREDSMTTEPMIIDGDGRHLYLRDSRGRNTAALYRRDLENGEQELVFEDQRADIDHLIVDPARRKVQGAYVDYQLPEIHCIDPDLGPHIEVLQKNARGTVNISSRSDDGRWWTVEYEADNAPVSAWLYDSQSQNARFMFTHRPSLEGLDLVPMRSEVIKARDGLDLVMYYSLPSESDPDGSGRPDRPLPMVLVPHGGPWHRDHWGYDPLHQWLANRGYAVASVNFRSSTGYGKAHLNAGNRTWATHVMQDQVDTVVWAIEEGIADENKIGILGGSFGGYSVLAGLTMYSGVFACGVDIVGPSNLVTLLESVPEYWKPMLNMMLDRVGDIRSEEGRALLTEHSPLTHVDNIVRPLLIGQGANDPRVKQAESDQIVHAMKSKGIPVTYILYPDEGHGFARPENRMSFFAAAEAFLAAHLGGRFEEAGSDFDGSSIQVPEGADQVPGLADALPK
jgi:dipeptidyl aminopeptidase/acylaminoacyl peptidase